MSKNTSVLLGDYFEDFVNKKMATGRYSSVSEVIREALRLLEFEENRAKQLINELKAGEKARLVVNFDRKSHLNKLHSKHIK